MSEDIEKILLRIAIALEVMADHSVKKIEPKTDRPKISGQIDSIGLPSRVVAACIRNGVLTVEDLTDLSADNFLGLSRGASTGLGQTSLNQTRIILGKLGLSLTGETPFTTEGPPNVTTQR